MRNECNIIRDILPLYIEDMLSGDTVDFVEEHLKNCVSCRIELQNMKRESRIESYAKEKQADDLAPLKAIKNKLRRYSRALKVGCILVACVLLITAFTALKEHRCQKLEEYITGKYGAYVNDSGNVDVIKAFGKVQIRYGLTRCEVNTRSDPWTDNYAEEYVIGEYLRSIAWFRVDYVSDHNGTDTFWETRIDPLYGTKMELLVDDVEPEDIQSKEHPFELEVYYDETMTDIQQLDEAVAVLIEYIHSIGLTNLRTVTAYSDAMTEAQLYNVTR